MSQSSHARIQNFRGVSPLDPRMLALILCDVLIMLWTHVFRVKETQSEKRFIYNILHKRLTTELATFGKSVSTLRRALIFKIETMLPLTGMVVTLVGFVGDGAPVKGLDGV